MHVLISKQQVFWLTRHVFVRVQVVCVDFHHDSALLHTTLLVGHFLASLIIIPVVIPFAKEDETLAIASWCDEHHVHHILMVYALVVSDLPDESVVLTHFML